MIPWVRMRQQGWRRPDGQMKMSTWMKALPVGLSTGRLGHISGFRHMGTSIRAGGSRR